MGDVGLADGGRPVAKRTLFLMRLAAAAAQGLALYLLTHAAGLPKPWPATSPRLFEALLLIATFAPVLLQLGFGQIRMRPLVVWVLVASVLMAGLGWHDAARERFEAFQPRPLFWPWIELWLALAASLFVANVLVIDAVIERQWMPPYPRHFDTAWKQGVQTVLAAVFVGVFWGVLELGAGLFKLLNVDFFQHLISHDWFAWPASTLALAVAIHVTDVQPALIRGARSLALTLFSWLLPLLALILLGFLGSLPFISLAPLWQTHFAASLLLVSAGLLVFLINTTYQDGGDPQAVSPIKRYAALTGAVELVPLVCLAAWAVGLRVGQYGWSVERIIAAAVTLIAGFYAIGYAIAIIPAPSWMKRIEIANFITAYVALAIFLALFSPIADPARLMVADQVARLEEGKLATNKFDYDALRLQGARWGQAALRTLAARRVGPNAEAIRIAAAQALAENNPMNFQPPTLAELPSRIVVYPAGRALPAGFYDVKSGIWANRSTPMCLVTQGEQPCLATFLALSPGAPEALIILDSTRGFLFQQDQPGRWTQTGDVYGAVACAEVRHGFGVGDIKTDPHPFPDLVIAGHRFSVASVAAGSDATGCGAPAPKPSPSPSPSPSKH